MNNSVMLTGIYNFSFLTCPSPFNPHPVYFDLKIAHHSVDCGWVWFQHKERVLRYIQPLC